MPTQQEHDKKLRDEAHLKILKAKAMLLDAQVQIVKMKAMALKARVQALKNISLITHVDL
ncbi:hypothetical protein [Emticicia soli]|uniref:Uncharacterized protein n=1 Tax=Emticicia soli TaxID=2027878 RepID=A0ABW5JE61_9BACT